MTKLLDIHFADDLHSVCSSVSQIKTFIYRLFEDQEESNTNTNQRWNKYKWEKMGNEWLAVILILFARQTTDLHYFEIQINLNVIWQICNLFSLSISYAIFSYEPLLHGMNVDASIASIMMTRKNDFENLKSDIYIPFELNYSDFRS